MTTRTTPVLFTREEVHKRVLAFCDAARNGKTSIVTADDIVWSFPGRSRIRENDKEYDAWVILKREVSNSMRTPELLEHWVQDSPQTPHSRRRWRLRDKPLTEPPLHRNYHSNPGSRIPVEALARYREALEGLVVVENGGFPPQPENPVIEPNTVVQYYSSTVLQYTRAERERERERRSD